MSTIALLLAIVLAHTDGDTFTAQIALRDIHMSRAACRRLFADQRNSPEIYPGIFVTPQCAVVAIVAVRIDGIDTPETHRPKCLREKERGAVASREVAKLLPIGSVITLRNVKHDKFAGRVDATVVNSDGVNVGDYLKQNGHAVAYTGEGPKEDWCAQ